MRPFLFFLLLPLLVPEACFGEEKSWGGGAEVSVASKYMVRGFKVGGNTPVLQPFLSLSPPIEGASVSVWSSLPLDRQRRKYDEFDLIARYSRLFRADSPFAIRLLGDASYWVYPNDLEDRRSRRGNQLHFGVSLPRLFLGPSGIQWIPSYHFYYALYWAQGRRDRFMGGAFHEWSIDHFRVFQTGWLQAKLSLNYHGGAYAIASGWSHVWAQVGAGKSWADYYASFAINRQWSLLSRIHPDHEFWLSASVGRKF